MVDKRTLPCGGGEAGAILRQLDWSTTAVGKPDAWPEALHVSLGIILNSDHAMLIGWGAELTQFYNDGFARLAWPNHGHFDALGTSGRTSSLWHAIAADVETVMAGNGGVSREHRRMPVAADGASPDRYWTYSLSPINGADGVAGVLLVCRDQTAECARERELMRIQHIGRIGGLEVDLTSGYRNWRSPGYLAIHGLPAEAANETHENWVSRIYAEDRYRTENTFVEAVRSDCKGYSIQYRIVRPADGKLRWISAKTEIERDHTGRPLKLIGAHADVTDQMDISAAERSRFTSALDLLRCSVLLTDANGGIVYMNRSAEELMNAGDAVRNRHNTIRAVQPLAGHELTEALKRAGRADGGIEKTGLAIKLSADGGLPVIAHVMPLAKARFQHELEFSAVAAIFIRNQESIGDSSELLATTYELTPAEARVLSCLLAGRSLSQAARELRVAHSTVKTHLTVIFRKTGVRRQSDLIMLASHLSAPVLAS